MLLKVLAENDKSYSVVVPPLSTVKDAMALLHKEGLPKDTHAYIRPRFWTAGTGLHPESRLPLVQNEYIVASDGAARLVEFDLVGWTQKEESEPKHVTMLKTAFWAVLICVLISIWVRQ